MTTVYLVRHAEAEGNTYRRIHGQYNSLITQNGLRQIEALRARFEPIHIDACFASDLFRTCRTAQSVYLAKQLPLHPEKRFRELEIGRWEDTPFGYLERFEKQDMDKFNFDERNWHVDGSETWEEYTDRFLGGLNDICAAQEGKTIAVFSHACVLRGMQKKLLKTDEIPFCRFFIVPYCLWHPLLVLMTAYLIFTDPPAFKRFMLYIGFGFGDAEDNGLPGHPRLEHAVACAIVHVSRFHLRDLDRAIHLLRQHQNRVQTRILVRPLRRDDGSKPARTKVAVHDRIWRCFAQNRRMYLVVWKVHERIHPIAVLVLNHQLSI